MLAHADDENGKQKHFKAIEGKGEKKRQLKKKIVD